MKRKSEKCGGYDVTEISVKTMFPIMRTMQDDNEAGQLALMGASLCKNGAAIGEDAVSEMGMSEYMSLIAVVTRVNGLETEEGND